MWMVGGLTVWLGLALLVAVVIGRGIRLADRRSVRTGGVLAPAVIDLPERVAAPVVRRRGIPVPPIGIALIVAAMALMTTG
jgi:hypothetical protein